MKKIILLFTATLCLTFVFGQQIPNGNLEVWDSTYAPSIYPVGWKTNADYAAPFCSPTLYTATKTNDKNSGNWAAELRADYCVDDYALTQIYIGFLACGNNIDFPYLPYGIVYNQRPSFLNFYYKFLKVGTDTGFAKVTLLTLDTIGQIDKIIGSGSMEIINSINNYTLASVPISYYFSDTPDVIQILFSTSKTLTENNHLADVIGNGANIGTTLGR